MTKKKDKILPIKVWLDEDSCWNNEPKYSEGYIEYVREDYHAQAILHVLQKGKEFGKEEMLENVCEWLEEHLANFFGESYIYEEPDTLDRCLKAMKKAMKEE